MLPHLKEMSIIGHGTALAVWFICAVMGVLLAPHSVAGGPAPAAFVAPGLNVALGKPYTLDPQPNYLTEPGDREQLTDGEYQGEKGTLWVQPGCVGWAHHQLVTATIDLGEIVPIAGLSFGTAGGAAGVGWPWAIVILVSDDGQDFHYVGELRSLSAGFGVPAPAGYQDHRFATDELSTHGRFVRLGIVAGTCHSIIRYIFCDEIEVYQGPNEMLNVPVDGPIITDLRAFVSQYVRIAFDIAETRAVIATAGIEDDLRQRLNNEIAVIEKANQAFAYDVRANAFGPMIARYIRSLTITLSCLASSPNCAEQKASRLCSCGTTIVGSGSAYGTCPPVRPEEVRPYRSG